MEEQEGKIYQLKEYFEKRGDIAMAFVFGSFAQGKETPLSDFDVAILFAKNVSPQSYEDRELMIAQELGIRIGVSEVDVINLATVKNPFLKHRAIFFGTPLFVADERLRFEIEREIRQEYEDTKYLRSTRYAILKRHIKKNMLGKAPLSYGQKYMSRQYVS